MFWFLPLCISALCAIHTTYAEDFTARLEAARAGVDEAFAAREQESPPPPQEETTPDGGKVAVTQEEVVEAKGDEQSATQFGRLLPHQR